MKGHIVSHTMLYLLTLNVDKLRWFPACVFIFFLVLLKWSFDDKAAGGELWTAEYWMFQANNSFYSLKLESNTKWQTVHLWSDMIINCCIP